MSNENQFIIIKNNIQFHLRELAITEVENALISLTELADLLGYKSKQDLQRLADRHSKELAELGVVGTVPITVKRGPVSFDDTEIAFNQPQVMYLVGHADTPNARAMHVKYVRGFFMLLDYVWRIETAKYEKPLTPAQLIYRQAELLVRMEAKNAEQEDAITSVTVETADLRTVQRVHTDAIQDLRSEVADIEVLATKPKKVPVKKATVVPKTPGVIRGTPPHIVPPFFTMHTIAAWAVKHRPANAPVLHSSLGRAASALYRDYYDGAIPSKSGLVEVDGIKRKVAVYPTHILQKAFRYTPRSKIGKKRKK